VLLRFFLLRDAAACRCPFFLLPASSFPLHSNALSSSPPLLNEIFYTPLGYSPLYLSRGLWIPPFMTSLRLKALLFPLSLCWLVPPWSYLCPFTDRYTRRAKVNSSPLSNENSDPPPPSAAISPSLSNENESLLDSLRLRYLFLPFLDDLSAVSRAAPPTSHFCFPGSSAQSSPLLPRN